MDVEQELLGNPDAAAWAKAFVATCRKFRAANPYNEGFMIGWFANAMAVFEAEREEAIRLLANATDPENEGDWAEAREVGWDWARNRAR